MTVQSLMREIQNLTLEEQFQLLESITRTVRETWRRPQRAGESLARVRGCLKPDGKTPTDADLTDLRDRALVDKYA